MDTTQLAQQVAWLDEQHRRDRNELNVLQQRVEAQNQQLTELSRKLQDSEGRLASVTAQLTRFNQVEQALAQLKEEVVLMLRREEEQRQIAERESGRLRLVERETTAKAINELRQQVRPIAKLLDELELRKAEDKRLSEGAIALRQELQDFMRQTENWPKSLTYLEEQRRLESKRTAQLQQESAETMKRTEEYRGRFEVADKALLRLEGRLNTLWNMRDEIRSEQVRMSESILIGEEERNRRVNAQVARFEPIIEQVDEFDQRMKQFAERFEQDQRTLAQLSQLEERLKRDQAQVAELQRLAEERMRKEYEEFQAEEERRWRRNLVAWDQRWSEQARTNTALTERFIPIEEQTKLSSAQIAQLWQVEQALARHLTVEAERWLADFSKLWEERARQV
jgi:hypothetical protein